MSPKRGDRIAPPPEPGGWDVRFANNEAARGWEELCRHTPGNALRAWTTMRRNPTPRTDSPRHHQLYGRLSIVTVGDKQLNHWQIEVTSGGRIWYGVDPDKATIWVDHAGPGHPKATA